MKKRFTDCDKWEDSWFRKLPTKYQALWMFLCDRCDIAGFWKVDLEYLAFNIKEEFLKDEILAQFNSEKERIRDLGSHWQIIEFIQFQYGNLSRDCRPHKAILDRVEEHKAKGLLRVSKGLDNGKLNSSSLGLGKGSVTLVEEEEDMDKDKEGGVYEGGLVDRFDRAVKK